MYIYVHIIYTLKLYTYAHMHIYKHTYIIVWYRTEITVAI